MFFVALRLLKGGFDVLQYYLKVTKRWLKSDIVASLSHINDVVWCGFDRKCHRYLWVLLFLFVELIENV